MTRPACAFYFHPDQAEGQGRDLVGRRSAGESFLKGYFRHMPGDEIWALTDGPAGAEALKAKAAALGADRPLRILTLRGSDDFTAFGTIFFPAPGYQTAPWRRQHFGPARCSLVGLTHTFSTRRVIEGLHHLLAEPVEDWDAIICTSRAVHSVVARQMALEIDYYRQRFGAARVPRPRLPVIPLGIATADFAPQPGARERLRAGQGTPEGAIVILTMGRIAVVEKANPLPLFIAAELAARATGRQVELWITGWASREEEMALHRDGAAAVCRSVKVRFLDGRDPDIRRNVWAAADIFTLAADSIQETFGLVPVEAMAAGLPVVMPDWDGFRDTVAHGRTGFRVPTRMASAGTGAALAARYADGTDAYLQHLVLVQSMIQIDVPSYARMLAELVRNDALRHAFGAEAARHARTHFDWSAVIPRYHALALELAAQRSGGRATTPGLAGGAIGPLEVDPFDLYGEYPTARLGPDDRILPGIALAEDTLDLVDRISGRRLYRRVAVAHPLLRSILAILAEKGAATPALLAAEIGESAAAIEGAVLTLAKADLVRLPRIPPRAGPFDAPPKPAGHG